MSRLAAARWPTPSPPTSTRSRWPSRARSARRSRSPASSRIGPDPMPKVLVVDNYDSFTYNLVQYLGELGCELDVVRNDRATVDELLERRPDRVVVSPGPCTPNEAGISLETVRRFPQAGVPPLGGCLGHQSPAQALRAHLVRRQPVHGQRTDHEH